jgi:hypothetical protein
MYSNAKGFVFTEMNILVSQSQGMLTSQKLLRAGDQSSSAMDMTAVALIR